MRNTIIFLSVAGFSAFFSMSANAADSKNGDKLHGNNCTRCHDSAVYTRENKRVSTLPKLGKQVRFCKDNLGIAWFDDEVNDVVDFLNTNYYHF
ncbi:MAG: cytochrome c [Gammaproteobacteria bacterium]|nr:cytochrome c [Gammaproteobacteria bacterium]